MATRKTTTKPAVEVEETVEDEAVAEPTFKQLATNAINDAADQLGVESKDRYKVQRAFGYIAMQNAIADGTLEALVEQVVTESGDLPAGFGLVAAVAAEKPAPKAKAAPAKKAPAKTAAKPATAKSTTARKRPTR